MNSGDNGLGTNLQVDRKLSLRFQIQGLKQPINDFARFRPHSISAYFMLTWDKVLLTFPQTKRRSAAYNREKPGKRARLRRPLGARMSEHTTGLSRRRARGGAGCICCLGGPIRPAFI